MLVAFLIALALLAAIQAIRAARLMSSALWLAGVSATLSIVFYLMGALNVAVIELSVGAGLVTVLFVFAINVAGEEPLDAFPLVPRPVAWVLVIGCLLLLGWASLPLPLAQAPGPQDSFATMLWQKRGLDVLAQAILIFAGVLGLLGLLAEARAPLDHPAALEIAAQRERDLAALAQQVSDRERERV